MAVEKGFQRIEDDIAKKNRRERNIVIRNVPESIENTNAKQNKCDKGNVEKILNIKQPSDIINVVRLGSQKDQDGNLIRTQGRKYRIWLGGGGCCKKIRPTS